MLRKGGKNTQKNCTKKIFHNPDNYNGVITHLEPDILEWEIKCALGSITVNEVSRGNGISVELFQILQDDAVKVLHSVWGIHRPMADSCGYMAETDTIV